MKTAILVGIGGGLGAMARHEVNHFVQQRALSNPFPIGIFLINVVGSIAIGLIAGAVASHRVQWSLETRTFLVVGILGGFTTFSSFSLDTLTLIRGGHFGLAAANVLGQVALSLIGVWAGYRVASL